MTSPQLERLAANTRTESEYMRLRDIYNDLPCLIQNKIACDSNSSCWLWTAATTPEGYGRVFYDGKTQPAHRVVYSLSKGLIPPGLHLDHLCRVTCCVNPDHLEPVTPAENVRRSESGRNNREKTHCPQGHPYSGDNLLRIGVNSGRYCRICREVRIKEDTSRQRIRREIRRAAGKRKDTAA